MASVAQRSKRAPAKGKIGGSNPSGRSTPIDAGLVGTAVFSKDKRYRYSLTRTWNGRPFEDPASRTVCWVMLNPSTADAKVLDPTIRRCVKFSRAWGFDGLEIVNAFAYRSTDPDAMFDRYRAGEGIIGRDNDYFVQQAALRASAIVAAWGANISKVKDRESDLLGVIGRGLVPIVALKVTKNGHPCHPLYLSANLQPRVFSRSSK